ncbi:MAG TPA: NAD(P)/FAD-dependent oxidoreductase, partial [Acidimicrobiales bacterium]|nr:NAD(P)/FAD-dependent oxidoreductase [Acidimicrobiales bacterium]
MTDHDVVIVGAGAAGVSCALECFDIQLDTVVFETEGRAGGQLAEIPHSVRNVATGRFVDGPAVRDGLEAAATTLGPRLRVGEPVTAIDLAEKWVDAGGERVHARALVVATGTRHQRLPAAPDGAFGGDVTYLVESEPGRFDGRAVVVIGGGDSGTLDALELASAGSAVTLVHRGPTLTARADIVERVRREPRIEDMPGWELESLHGGDRLEEVVLRDRDGQRLRVPAGGVVVKIARRPRTELVRGQVDLDRSGAIVVDAALHTSRE